MNDTLCRIILGEVVVVPRNNLLSFSPPEIPFFSNFTRCHASLFFTEFVCFFFFSLSLHGKWEFLRKKKSREYRLLFFFYLPPAMTPKLAVESRQNRIESNRGDISPLPVVHVLTLSFQAFEKPSEIFARRATTASSSKLNSSRVLDDTWGSTCTSGDICTVWAKKFLPALRASSFTADSMIVILAT